MAEKWAMIYGGRYAVSDRGRVKTVCLPRSQHRKFVGKIKSLSDNGCGYLRAKLTGLDGVSDGVLVHRLVALAFVPGHAEGLTVNHKDGDKTNNRASNLEWLTRGDNCRHYTSRLNRCCHGHKFSKENTRIHNGHRSCRACARIRYHDRKRRGVL